MALGPRALVINEFVRKLPTEITEDSKHIKIDFSGLSQLNWKGKLCNLSNVQDVLEQDTARVSGNTVEVDKELPPKTFKKLLDQLSLLSEKVAKDNLLSMDIWGQTESISPSGFDEKADSASKDFLKDLYQDDYVVQEKKPLVLDMDACQGPYLVSTMGGKTRSLMDGASQIASLALGFNDPAKNPMGLRPEVFDPELDLEKWDVTEAFEHFLKKETGLPHVQIVNSGAEAIETCLRACQVAYPDRKKVVSFEGSFHGRALFSLHCTHSPAKRTPYEIYKGVVSFLPFPTNNTPGIRVKEPKNWIEIWSQPETSDLKEKLTALGKDALLEKEIETLLEIQKLISARDHLAVLVEPMQCEGGDRFASNRFFRALRLLTRAYDTALIFDEVQTGFGLGEEFFWHKEFQLVDEKGRPDTPDCVAVAKKAQIGACITRVKQDLPLETSAASIYRGYLHAVYSKDFDSTELSNRVTSYLEALQRSLGKDLVQNPRNTGITFAFDLPDADTAKALVAQRFPNTIMFYPAGTQTARFRLIVGTTERELNQLFKGIYGCFVGLAETDVVKKKIPTLDEWADSLPDELQTSFKKTMSETPGLKRALPWNVNWLPNNKEEYLATSQEKWSRLFSQIVKAVPQILRSPQATKRGINELSSKSAEDLWSQYESDDNYTMLDLLFDSSRALGFPVSLVNETQVKDLANDITKLEAAAYEPERRDPPELFIRIAKDPKTMIFVSKGVNGSLTALCTATHPSNFENLKLLREDPRSEEPDSLYSNDISIHPDYQGKGLGLRMKCEQYIEAIRRKSSTIRSRNRYPEAKAMAHLNRRLSSVVTTENPAAYGGEGLALYQTIELHAEAPAIPLRSPYLPALKNKSTLSNFISSTYINNLLLIKKFLPAGMRHIYLSSGRCEAVDKVVKLLYSKRPKSKFALSFTGDYFGDTTAAARSLGGTGELSFFDWPRLDPANYKAELEKMDPDEIMGIFVEPIVEKTGSKRDASFLDELVGHCRKQNIPVVFDETASSFYRYDSNLLFVGDHFKADISFCYPGHQLGVIITNDKYYLEKPLMMISTWDGDEHSLNLFRDRILETAPKWGAK